MCKRKYRGPSSLVEQRFSTRGSSQEGLRLPPPPCAAQKGGLSLWGKEDTVTHIALEQWLGDFTQGERKAVRTERELWSSPRMNWLYLKQCGEVKAWKCSHQTTENLVVSKGRLANNRPGSLPARIREITIQWSPPGVMGNLRLAFKTKPAKPLNLIGSDCGLIYAPGHYGYNMIIRQQLVEPNSWVWCP